MKRRFFHSLKWLPNAITLSRVGFASAAFLFALNDQWPAGFWLLLTALATDFLDGLAARRLDAVSKFGEEIDAMADSVVVVLGLLSLNITGHLPWWVGGAAIIVGLAMASDRLFDQPRWKWRAIAAVSSLFVAWIGIVWLYAYVAFGWSWLYIIITLFILGFCAATKQRRIKAWLHG